MAETHLIEPIRCGTAPAIGLVFAPRMTRLVASIVTALIGADFLQLAYAVAQQSAEG